MRIVFWNTKKYDKTIDELINNPRHRGGGGGDDTNTKEEYWLVLKNAVPDKIALFPVKDLPLNPEEIKRVQTEMAKLIRPLLENRVPLKTGSEIIDFEGEKIKLNTLRGSKNKNDFTVSFYYRVYDICRECLLENKPMYLSVTEE
ncbi:MAG: hypothetical protein NTW29_04060 [Bacteroidetes bacterium]|nr:hypothetical protein [Bacteroidota bacterium]